MLKEKNKVKPHLIPLTVRLAAVAVSMLVLIMIALFNIFGQGDNVNNSDEVARVPLDENLLANPSFERNPLQSGSIWQIDERGTDLVSDWTDDTVHSGDYALQLTTSDAGNQGWPGLFTTVPIADGLSYTFSAQMVSLDGASGWLSIDLYDADDNFVRGYSTGCAESVAEWHQRDITVTPEQYKEVDASYMRLGLLQCLNNSEGSETTLYIDDVSLMAE